MRIAQSGYIDNGDGTLTATAAPAYAALRASYTNDLMGRVTRQIDWLGDGTNAGYDRTVTLQRQGPGLTTRRSIQQAGQRHPHDQHHQRFRLGHRPMRSARSPRPPAPTTRTASTRATSTTTNSYAWYDGAVQSLVSHDRTRRSHRPHHHFTYDGSGQLASHLRRRRPPAQRHLRQRHQRPGDPARRKRQQLQPIGGDPHEVWYRFGGKQIGYVGNNGTLDTDYRDLDQQPHPHPRHRAPSASAATYARRRMPISTSASRRSTATARASRPAATRSAAATRSQTSPPSCGAIPRSGTSSPKPTAWRRRTASSRASA